ncbi:MAG: leucine-rich repeat domain-containing protein, partial [Candidatus Izemoplasmatales bacterium]
IGDEAFRGITNVNYVFIPDSVVTIGDHILNLTLAVNAVFIESSAPKEGWSEFAFEEALTLIYGYQSMVEENNAIFAITSNNEAILIGMLVDTIEGDYTIPETVLGYPVVKISSWAFHRTSIFGTLTIADNIVQIDSSAFTMAYATQIVFSSTSKLAYIRNGAFFSFGSTEMVLPNSVLTIEGSAFYNAEINQIFIPSSVTEIGEYALSSYRIHVILMESDVISNEIVSTWINPLSQIYFNQDNPYVVHNDYWTYE